jgi:FtsH-binding integral membrane protein
LVLYFQRHSFPMNFILLSAFTLAEAFTLGVAVAFYETTIVLQALLITIGVFAGLTLFTFQSKVRSFISKSILIFLMSISRDLV